MKHRIKQRERRRRKWAEAHATLWTVLFTLALIVVGAVVTLALSERRVGLPDMLTEHIEERLNIEQGHVRIAMERISLGLSRRGVPRIWFENVSLHSETGVRLAELGQVVTAFDTAQLFEGRIAPSVFRAEGAHLIVRRDRNGAFEFELDGNGMAAGGIGAALDMIDRTMSQPPFDKVVAAEIGNAIITLEDARSSRIWQISGAEMSLLREPDGFDLSLIADVFNGTDTLARVQSSVRTFSEDGRATLSIDVDNAEAVDIALQSPVLSFLSLLDAPMSAALRTTLDERGNLETFAGTLQIAEGGLRPRGDFDPIPFQSAQAYFTFDPTRQRLNFTDISVESEAGSGRVSGHTYLREIGPGGFPSALVGQFEVANLSINGDRYLANPVTIREGHVDLRMRLAPFALEVGQLVLRDDAGETPRFLRGSGHIEAEPGGYALAVDLNTEKLPVARLMDFWPVPVALKTRAWMDRNVSDGMLHDVQAAFRFKPGDEKPEISTTFVFDDATIQAVRGMPPITGGAGYGSIIQRRLGITLDAGEMSAGDGPPVSLAGSTMLVANTREKPALGEFNVVSQGPLTSVLEVLNRPPLNLLKDSGRDADLAEAEVSVTSDIALRLRKGNQPEDIQFAASGVLSDLTSDRLVEDRILAADSLTIDVTREAITLAGEATFDGIPFTGSWRRILSGDERGQGRVRGQIALSNAHLATLGVPLPNGLLSGQGSGALELTLTPGEAPAFTLGSNLAGLGLSIPAINWSKAVGATGSFQISGALGPSPRIDRVLLDAPALRAEGDIALNGRTFAALNLSRVQVRDWLDASVRITSRGRGVAPSVAVTGGTVDIRKAQLGGDAGSSGSGAARGPVNLRLDRLVITDTIALEQAEIALAEGRAISGRFSGRLNGGTSVEGQLSGGANGTAIRVRSNDAGAVVRDAGLFRRVEGGQMDLVLQPTGQRGTYDGTVRVTDPRLRDAPAVASLLSAVSVVGLVEQMQTGGIPFDEVDASFRISPGRITLYRSSAVGSSLGLSMDGVYDPATQRMDMQGVVSPFYLINSIGSIFTRRGEGLVGISFTLRGPARSPSVNVNPLSVFTPGMFREIFRRPPPRRTGQAQAGQSPFDPTAPPQRRSTREIFARPNSP